MENLTKEQSAQFKALKAKIRNLHAKIKSIRDQGSAALTDQSKVFLFRGMYKQLSTHYEQMLSTWSELTELSYLYDISQHFPTDNDKKSYDDAECKFYETCAIYDVVCVPTSEAPQNATATNTSLNESRTVRARLPEINLPRFSGVYSEWPLFRDTYVSLIHDETTLSKIEKFHFLLSSLSGPALTLVKGVSISEQNYDQAWKLLKDNYDDKRRLASSYLKTVLNFVPFKSKPNADGLKHFLSTVIEAIASFGQLKLEKAEEFILLFLVLRCLDVQTRKEFERKHAEDKFPSYESLLKFLRAEMKSLELTSDDYSTTDGRSTTPNSKVSFRSYQSTRPRSSLFAENDTSTPINRSQSSQRSVTNDKDPKKETSTQIRCPVCKSNHYLYQCLQFKSSPPRDRLHYLKDWKGCTNCLSSKHTKGQCPSAGTCRTCGQRHHSWLHVESSASTRPPSKQDPESQPAVTLTGTSHSGEVILGTAIVQIKDSYERYQPVRLVVDCGSQHSFITSDCAKRLGLKPHPASLTISGIGQVHVPETQGELSCTLRSRHGKHQLQVTSVVVPEITGNLPHSTVPYEFHSLIGAYHLADPTYWKPQPIDFLLGADVYFDVVTGSPIEIRPGFPKLIPSLLGHIVAGRCAHENPTASSTSLFVRKRSNAHDLQEVMTKFWNIEEVPEDVPWTNEERACEEHFLSNHYRLASGRYVVALPFKDSIDQLRSPIQQVEGRFKKLEYRLDHDPLLKAQYHDFMAEYQDLHHMTPASDTGKYHIPHHCVTKQDGEKKKIRVVFDASCKGPNGSLNCHLMTGPKLQNDICDIILKFRTCKIVIVADIVKMYRQILVRPGDRTYQRILWRFNQLEPVREFELNTVTYGIASSAFLAIRSLQQLARDEGDNYPLAAQALLNDVYVDDIVTGGDSLEEALHLQTQLIQLLNKGCFELSKWKSNHQQLLDSVQAPQQDETFTIQSGEDNSGCKILGLQWIPSADVFTFHIQKPTAPSTKRGILSTIARIFDPLGYLAPVVFQAKIILQQVWLAQCDWDSSVPENLQLQWQSFSDRLPDLHLVRIPRFMSPKDGVNFILGFADASQRGYAAVLYLHTRTSSNQSTYLLKSKTKLAPTHLTSIPRLELCAALLLSKLLRSCSNLSSLLRPETTLLFTDSTVVLGWLSTPINKLKAFVAHRVSEILDLTNSASWNHIDSTSNPADCASRGLMPGQLAHHSLWWTGPSWLSHPPPLWPKGTPASIPDDLPELKPPDSACLLVSKRSSIIDWVSRSSSYLKTIRSLALSLRFIARLRRQPVLIGPVSLKELDDANTTCIRLAQMEFLPSLQVMQNSKPWKSLMPFLDSRGLLRVGGRLHHANLPYNARHPLILPKCHFTRLLISHYHQSYLHIGATTMQSMIQGRYYIMRARNLIRSCIRHCIKCQRANPRSQPPLMGNVPQCRLQEGLVFQNVGVDLGGPFPLKESNRRKASVGKAYLCLFVCMVTKALHLEVVSSCSTEAFLAALNRFISRRGSPLNIYSDCGSNFIGAASTLKELHKWFKAQGTQEDISNYASERGINWHMIPPRSPHFGGLWEAGIKSAKALLSKNLAATSLTFEELSTIFCRIEAVLNSRPLCPINDDSHTIDCLTPGHFLIGRALTSLPEQSLLDLKENTLNRWQLIQQRVQHFWSRWRHEYLNQLQQRRKWTSHSPCLKEGDLVILKDDNAPIASWPLARIVATHPGNDGVVRVATIRTQAGVYKRPAVKLIPLALPNQNE